MKTLGQIAMDAWDEADNAGETRFNVLWEAATQAVREAVLREAIEACHQNGNGKAAEDLFWHFSHGDEEWLQK